MLDWSIAAIAVTAAGCPRVTNRPTPLIRIETEPGRGRRSGADLGQSTGSAFFRVARRFGASGSVAGAVAPSGASVVAVDADRVRRAAGARVARARAFAGAAASTPPLAAVDASDSPELALRGARVERRRAVVASGASAARSVGAADSA